jgi:hypothetical protein
LKVSLPLVSALPTNRRGLFVMRPCLSSQLIQGTVYGLAGLGMRIPANAKHNQDARISV